MKQFNILVADTPGALANTCEILAKGAINIKAIASELKSGKALIKIVTDDESSTRAALTREHAEFTESEILNIKLVNQPGELLKVLRKLTNAGINLQSIYILGKEQSAENGKTRTEVALTVDKQEKARVLLKGLV